LLTFNQSEPIKLRHNSIGNTETYVVVRVVREVAVAPMRTTQEAGIIVIVAAAYNTVHPQFTFEWNNTTYSFMHSGDCYSFKDDFYNELVNYDTNWLTTHPSNWGATSYSQFIDSEILFHFIMSRVIQNKGYVVTGIMSALNEQDVDGENFEYAILKYVKH